MDLTAINLKAFFDANPSKYKSAGAYLPTDQLGFLLGAASAAANPVTVAPQIPKPFTMTDLFGAVATASVGNVVKLAAALGIQADVDKQDRAALGNWAAALVAAGSITSADQTAIVALLNATIPDPAWTSTIPGPSDLQGQFGVGSVPHLLIEQAVGRA